MISIWRSDKEEEPNPHLGSGDVLFTRYFEPVPLLPNTLRFVETLFVDRFRIAYWEKWDGSEWHFAGCNPGGGFG